MATRLAVRGLPLSRCICSVSVVRPSARAFANVALRSPSATLLSAVSRFVDRDLQES